MTGKSLKHRESVPQWLHFVIYWHQWNVPASPHQKYPPHLTFSNQPTSQLHCTMVSLQLRDNLIVFFAWTKLGSDFTSNKEITETDRQIGIYALTIYGRFMPLTFKRLILPTYRYSEWRLVLQSVYRRLIIKNNGYSSQKKDAQNNILIKWHNHRNI